MLYNEKIIKGYFSDPLKKHNNSIESIKETEKQSKEAAPLSDFQSSYKGDNSPSHNTPPKLFVNDKKFWRGVLLY